MSITEVPIGTVAPHAGQPELKIAGLPRVEFGVLEPGREALEQYFDLRRAAEALKQPIDESRLAAIHEDSYLWLEANEPSLLQPGKAEDYTQYDQQKVHARLVGLMKYLEGKYSYEIDGNETMATQAFVAAAFGMWKSKDAGQAGNVHDGSFAFIVPPRVSRKNPEYGSELEDLVHVMRYVPRELRAAMLRGVPPWVVDQYQMDEHGKRGYLICAPVTGDMEADLSVGEAVRGARRVVNDAVDLAADGFGVWAIGYGATFPRLMRYGTETRRSDVVTTTGHGGTVVQICNVIEAYQQAGIGKRIGVIGVGAIGGPAAEALLALYKSDVTVYDLQPERAAKLVAASASPERLKVAESIQQLIRESDIVVSAVTQAVHLRQLGVASMHGKGVVDDSQPAGFDPLEVSELGGVDAWPIGSDATGSICRNYYGYGDLMARKLTDLFGCEAEVAAIVAQHNRYLALGIVPDEARRMASELAIRGPVKAEQIRGIARLFKQMGIGRAALQSAGRLAAV